jgi:thioesterase superfamily protein 4
MDDASISSLESISWVARLINDPKWTQTQTGSRLPKASTEDSFFAETLATERTIRSCLTLRTTQESNDDLPYKEIVTIVELGDGLNGFPKLCHGGMLATLLDEVCGVLIMSNTARSVERAKSLGSTGQAVDASYMTACKSVSRSRVNLQN